MTLQELQISSYLIQKLSNDDNGYIDIANRQLNLNSKEDQERILKFLNDWGCRQFKRENHKEAAESLKNWFSKFEFDLPNQSLTLIEHSEKKLYSYKTLFNDLMNSYASTKINGKKSIINRVGPVGAAKTLFALRKHSFPPWDNPIINKLKLSKDGKGYCHYLSIVQEQLISLKEECKIKAIDIKDLPTMLGRPYVSLVKLIDEFFWISITRKCEPVEIIKLIKNV